MIIRIVCGRVIAFAVVFTVCIGNAFSQVTAMGDLRDFVESKIESLPGSGSNVYVNPTMDEISKWAEAIDFLFSGDALSAHNAFGEVGYRIVALTSAENGKLYYIIEKEIAATNYWGLYVIDPLPCRSELVIQSPHPSYDTNTGKQGIYTFLELEARAFFLSGTHRCSSSTESECSGTTSACGSSGPYRISDPAHNADGMFQIMTSIFMEDRPETVFIQLHGFGKQSGDPNAILSNGTRITPQRDLIGQLIQKMNEDDPTLTFKAAHLDLSWDRLVAFTNTQGRMLNGSSVPCTSGATTTTGQFIHIEQELSLFRSSESGWAKWISPMQRVFDCEDTVPLTIGEKQEGRIYPNPFTDKVSFTGADLDRLIIFDTSGRKVAEVKPESWSNVDLHLLQRGIFIYHVLEKQGKIKYSGKLIHQ